VGRFEPVARDVDAGQQVGDLADFSFVGHAVLWSGSAASWVDLSPVGTYDSVAYAVDAGVQVGAAKNIGEPFYRAFLWMGTAASALSLHSLLPADFNASEARDVWVDAGTIHVAGFGYNGTTARTEALLWVYVPPCASRR
jgi:hypothetical protein